MLVHRIQLTITLLLDERTDGGSLRFQVGSVMLERIGKLHPGFTKTFFSASILSSVAPTGLTSGKVSVDKKSGVLDHDALDVDFSHKQQRLDSSWWCSAAYGTNVPVRWWGCWSG